MLIYKTDIYEEGLLTPRIDYEIYDIKSKSKLDLNICKDLKIKVFLPCIIDENIEFKYNSSSDYYNDICYPYTTEKGTDIILLDRKKEYTDNNLSLCENYCEYGGYDSNIQKAICDCEIKPKVSSGKENEDKIDKEKLLNTFININDIINLKIIKCYKKLFTIEGIKNNVGNFVILFIILINIICTFALIGEDFELLIKVIQEKLKW